MSTLTTEQREIAKAISDVADDGGVIQAWDMVELSRRGLIPSDPTLHTTTMLDRAWALAGLPDDTSEQLYG